MSSLVSSAAAAPQPPPKLPTIEDVHGPGCTKRYDLTLYKLGGVPDAYYSDDDKNFYHIFDASFKPYLKDAINSREDAELPYAKKGLCIGWVDNVTIKKGIETRPNLSGIIGPNICGLGMEPGFLSNRYAELKQVPHVGVLVMLVTINITTATEVIVFPVFCLSFSTLRIDGNPVLVINGVCTNKIYSDGCPLYAFLFYKAVEHCIATLTQMEVKTILSALAEAAASYLRSGFGPRSDLDPKDPLRKFMKNNLSDYGSDYADHIRELAMNSITTADPTGMLNPSVIAAINASVVAPITTLVRHPTGKISNMQAQTAAKLQAEAQTAAKLQAEAQAAAKLQAEAQVERDRLAQEQVDRSKAYNALHKKAKNAYDSRQKIRGANVKKKYTVNPYTAGGRTKKNKKISRKRTFTSKIRKNKKHRKQKTKRR